MHKCFFGSYLPRYDSKTGAGSGVDPVLLVGIAPLGSDPDCEMGGIHTAECIE